MSYNEFKSKFVNFFSKIKDLDNKLVSEFKATLDKTVLTELPLRDSHRTFVVRSLTNSENLLINYYSDNLMCKYSFEKKSVLVGAIAPSWAQGWERISRDEYISFIIDSFFFLANQYVYRGYQINVLGAIALTYGLNCSFINGNIINKRIISSSELYEIDFYENVSKVNNKRFKLFSYYVDLINSFNPSVNRVLHYYVRSISLLKDGYYEEAVISADNAIDVILQTLKVIKSLPTQLREKMYDFLTFELNLKKEYIKQLKYLYKLRCHFSAHPAQSNWWDFYEIYSEDIEEIMYYVKLTIIKFLLYEESHRNIEKHPDNWSEWFVNNCNSIYDAVWHHKLP